MGPGFSDPTLSWAAKLSSELPVASEVYKPHLEAQVGFLAAKTHGAGPGYEETQSRAKIIRWQGLALRGLVGP